MALGNDKAYRRGAGWGDVLIRLAGKAERIGVRRPGYNQSQYQ